MGVGGPDFPHLSRRPQGPTQLPVRWVLGHSPGVKLPECGVEHPPSTSAEVKERARLLYLLSSGLSWPVLLLIRHRKLIWVYYDSLRQLKSSPLLETIVKEFYPPLIKKSYATLIQLCFLSSLLSGANFFFPCLRCVCISYLFDLSWFSARHVNQNLTELTMLD